MKRTTSLILIFALIFADAAFALDGEILNNGQRADKLAPPIVLDDIAANTPHNKNIVLAEMALEMDLEVMDSLRDIDGADNVESIKSAFKRLNLLKEKSFEKNPDYRPDRIIVFFNSIEPLGGHIFSVPISVNKNEKQYRLLFSTLRRQGEMFPTVFCTDEQLKIARARIIERDRLPQVSEKDTRARRRYKKNNEKIIDRWIAEHMKDKNDFIEIEPDELGILTFKEPFGSINKALGGIPLKWLAEKRIVLIRVKQGEKRPIIEENGEKIEVNSHTSKHSLYIFLDEYYHYRSGVMPGPFLMFSKNIERWREARKIDSSLPPIFESEMDSQDFGFMLSESVNPYLLRETGVMAGLKFEVKDGRIVNDMDRLYKEAVEKTRQGNLSAIMNLPLARKLYRIFRAAYNWDKNEFLSVDLDNLTGTNAVGEEYERDYAAAETDESDEDDEKPKLSVEEGLARIDAIWETIEDKVFSNPFDPDIQIALHEIVDIRELMPENMTHATIYNFIFMYSYIIAKGEYKTVLSYLEENCDIYFAKNVPNTGVLWSKENFIWLYFIVRIMDPEGIDKIVASKEPFFDSCALKLFGGFFNDNFRKVFGEDWEGWLRTSIMNYCLTFINSFKSSQGGYENRILADNCIKFIENEANLKAFAGEYDEAFKIIDYSLNYIKEGDLIKRSIFSEMFEDLLRIRKNISNQKQGAKIATLSMDRKQPIDRKPARMTKGDDVGDTTPGYRGMVKKLFPGLVRKDPDEVPVRRDPTTDFNTQVERVQDYGIGVSKTPKATLDEAAIKLVPKSQEALPEEYKTIGINYATLADELNIASGFDLSEMDEHSVLIFSEAITFEHGLGAILPRLAENGIKVTVVAPKEREQALIEELNRGKDKDRRIEYAENIELIKSKVKDARYYYYRLPNEPAVEGIINVPMAIELIIKAMGRVCSFEERSKEIEQFKTAMEIFKSAA